MLATVGDLVEDVVVRLAAPVNPASDTAATIERCQGGSAATVAVAARRLGAPARLIAQVGDDATGRALVAGLDALGVDVASIRFDGTTGTIVVLVEPGGERSMLTDRRAALALEAPDPAWLDAVEVLHVPYYSLAVAPLAETARTLIGWAHERRIPVSIDLSSAAVIADLGAEPVRRSVETLRPAVVFANEDEAATLGLDAPIGDAVTVVKHGRRPVVVHAGADRWEIEVPPVADVDDTTGAGDAFAAGFLTDRAPDGRLSFTSDPRAAAAAGIRSAAIHLAARRDRAGDHRSHLHDARRDRAGDRAAGPRG